MEKKYNPKEIEEKWQKYWEKEQIYKYDPKSTKPIFSVDTPPPYVSSAHLHVGHAMSYSQAEFVVRFWRMMGYEIFYPMGFDDNGLPTERFVEKKYKVEKSKITRDEFINLCLKETKIGAKTYETLWRSLGLSVDWSLLYSTIDERCRRISQRSFIDLFKKNRIERYNEPFIWCPHCETALAQAEIETEEKETKLNYIIFDSESGDKLTIATTRPELIPACVAMFVNPEDDRYKHLIDKNIIVPTCNYQVKVYADNDVDMEFGTGLMMVCTWGDADDVKRWKENSLDTRVILDKNGKLNDLAGDLQGLNLKEARKKILEKLAAENRITKQEKLSHQVGVHERCHVVSEFIQTPQWFIKVLDIKDELLARGKELKFYPDYFRSQYEHWVSGLKWDWCISRQRYYGVPFPIWYCADCNEIILPQDKDLPVDPMTDCPTIKECPKCKCKEFLPELDVMDTWMTSSLTPLINALWMDNKSRIEKTYPMTVRVQAFEIIRTWLFYTVVKSHLHTESLPFKDAMISGWTLDKKGKKISKSKGNFVPPDEIFEKYSVDSFRLWAASSNLGQNINFNEEEVRMARKTCVKLWNAARFIKAHIENLEAPDLSKVINPTDKWIISKQQGLIKRTTEAFKVYEYSRVKHDIDKFFWMDFCDNYLEIVKDRLYKPEIFGEDQKESASIALHYIFLNILKIFAPLMPYVTEELYSIIYGKEKSIHITKWPESDNKLTDPKSEELGEMLCEIISKVRGYKTENKLSLGAQLCELTIIYDQKLKDNLKSVESDLKSVTRASEIKWEGKADISCANFEVKLGIKV